MIDLLCVFQFTVTRVDSEPDHQEIPDGLSDFDSNDNDLKLQHNSTSAQPHAGQNEALSIQMPRSDNRHVSDSESSCGDTLTQTSITQLLSKKFKVHTQVLCNLFILYTSLKLLIHT